MLQESSKLSKLSRKPTMAFLSLGLLQLPTHPRVVELDGMRSKRSPLAPATQQGEALKKEFLC